MRRLRAEAKDERIMHDPYQAQRQQRGNIEGDEDAAKQSHESKPSQGAEQED
jgi:hypothetical protein